MAESYLLRSLEIAGFRAYLQPKAFDLSKRRCLAVFAPNGNGKSSVIDALEFIFSKDGTLARLGQRAINNQAGPIALAHNLAEEAGIRPTVSIQVASGNTLASGSRQATGTRRDIPEIAAILNKHFIVSPIIRGHELRSFVEVRTPEQRYADIATWLQLRPLVEVQRNIRTLRTQIKAAAEDATALQRVDAQLAKETSQVERAWKAEAVLVYANSTILAPMDPALALSVLATNDPAYKELEARSQVEANKIGLAGLRQIRKAAAALWSITTQPDSGAPVVTGIISTFEEALAALTKAVTKEEEERGKAANSEFENLWYSAQRLLVETSDDLTVCPICTTPMADTAAGSHEAIRQHIDMHLAELADYATAKRDLDTSRTVTSAAQTNLMTGLSALVGLLGDDESALKADLTAYENAIADWPKSVPPASTEIVAALSSLISSVDQSVADIESKQGDHTYIKAKARIDRLLDLEAEFSLALRTQHELAKISGALATQATTVSADIRTKVQTLLDKLQKPMNEIYKLIQGPDASTIRLELPSEDDTNQQRLNLLIDFAENRTGVQPSGYLSDSQIHSVALALRMAAIKQFNAIAPIMALDDIVTSYDADHRRAISGLIASTFGDCQILITTHDERFFHYLKDQLEANTWHFTRIIGLDPSYGPRFADHKVSDEMIEARWDSGQSAANEMRQAEEEWLLGISRDFGVSLRIRTLEKAYSYERSELANALASFLKNAKITPELVPGVNNRFLASLAKGEIENFGSHFQDGPYGSGSIGDEKARWVEFKNFRSQFKCKKCNRVKFQRPFTVKKPICAHGDCEVQFTFS